MEYLFAPMEGITFSVFRRIHHAMFPGISEYYTPFLGPDKTGSFKPKYLKELTADREDGLNLIPQVLANNSYAFTQTCIKLHALGFDEINLNAGCPSGTVYAKHKGAGMLADLSSYEHFLDDIFTDAEQHHYRISIKTRMGDHSTEEFPSVCSLYAKYPLSRLIIHARARDGFYMSRPDLSGFAKALSSCPWPVTYNGNLFSRSDLNNVITAAPSVMSFMIARGAVANPALNRTLSGGPLLSSEELRSFHDALAEGYLQTGLSPFYTAERMKQLWYYMGYMFPDSKKEQKAVLKAKTFSDYASAAAVLFSSGKFNAEKCFTG